MDEDLDTNQQGRNSFRLEHHLTAKNLARWNLMFVFIWIFAIVPTLVWWKNSILWVAFMSLWANIAAHFAAWIAARAEEEVEAFEKGNSK